MNTFFISEDESSERSGARIVFKERLWDQTEAKFMTLSGWKEK